MVLATMHRRIAVQEWSKLRESYASFDNLDGSLAAFDMFVLHDDKGDMDDVSCMEGQ